jgi:hypothetical protein
MSLSCLYCIIHWPVTLKNTSLECFNHNYSMVRYHALHSQYFGFHIILCVFFKKYVLSNVKNLNLLLSICQFFQLCTTLKARFILKITQKHYKIIAITYITPCFHIQYVKFSNKETHCHKLGDGNLTITTTFMLFHLPCHVTYV